MAKVTKPGGGGRVRYVCIGVDCLLISLPSYSPTARTLQVITIFSEECPRQ